MYRLDFIFGFYSFLSICVLHPASLFFYQLSRQVFPLTSFALHDFLSKLMSNPIAVLPSLDPSSSHPALPVFLCQRCSNPCCNILSNGNETRECANDDQARQNCPKSPLDRRMVYYSSVLELRKRGIIKESSDKLLWTRRGQSLGEIYILGSRRLLQNVSS